MIRAHQPLLVSTALGAGIHPDHKATTDIVTHRVFYARLPKWEQVPGGEALGESQPHEISRLFSAHCRMEAPWPSFDFAVDISRVFEKKAKALSAYESVFRGSQEALLDKYSAEDR